MPEPLPLFVGSVLLIVATASVKAQDATNPASAAVPPGAAGVERVLPESDRAQQVLTPGEQSGTGKLSAEDLRVIEQAPDSGQQPLGIIEREPIPDLEPLGLMERSIVIVDDAQRAASERFGNFMSQVDGFFSNAGADDDAISNDSWARIRFDSNGRSGQGFDFDPSIKVRAVLPRTERKLKLLISTEDDDDEDKINPNDTPQGDQGGSIALRFIRSARDSSDLNLDIGVRRREGLVQYFTRVKARLKLDIENRWLINVANSYWYYNKTGFLDTLSIDARRLLFENEFIYFRTFTDFTWEQGQRGAAIGNTTGFYWFLDAKRSLAVEVLADYYTSLSEEIRDRFRGHTFRVRWRQNIWRPWFFYDVWPSVSYRSTNDYRREVGLLLRAEIIIGHIK